MAWSTRRGLWLVGWLCVGLVAGLTGAIVTVSMLSARDRISLAGGIAVFVVVVVSWAAACVWLGMRCGGGADVTGRHRATSGCWACTAAGWSRADRRDHRRPADVGRGPADVRPAPDVAHSGPTGRWLSAARCAEVVGSPVPAGSSVGADGISRSGRSWSFSSDPLAELTAPHERPPAATVAAAARRGGARDVATFGCRPDGDAAGGDLVHSGRVQDWPRASPTSSSPSRVRSWWRGRRA